MKKKIKEKRERALGAKLFIKPERCNSPKCALTKKPYRPGVHGQRRVILSEYGKQLKEKQKIQAYFGLTNTQMRNAFKGRGGDEITSDLKSRLDHAVYSLGLAPSVRSARQLVSHGHIMVNNRRGKSPSRRVNLGDKISIRPGSKEAGPLKDLKVKLENYTPPEWLKLEKQNWEGEVIADPAQIGEPFPFDINLVAQFYAR